MALARYQGSTGSGNDHGLTYVQIKTVYDMTRNFQEQTKPGVKQQRYNNEVMQGDFDNVKSARS